MNNKVESIASLVKSARRQDPHESLRFLLKQFLVNDIFL